MSGLAEDEIQQAPWIIWAKRGGGAVLGLVMLFGVIYLGKELSAPASQKQKQVAKIKIVPDTPPPPPPPEIKRPEPKEVKEAKVEQPKPQPAPQDTEQIKMEGKGSDNGLAGVAAGTVRSDYVGGNIGDGGSRFQGYLGNLQIELNRALQKMDKLRLTDYRIVVRVWLSADGMVSRAELVGSTGNADIDERIQTALSQLPPLRERPPEGLPQPIRVRLTSR
jgi:protein TonB